MHNVQRKDTMIGLSLSFCVKAILQGKVAEADVDLIVCGTKADNTVEMHNVLQAYKENYWYENPDEGVAIARRLLKAGKLFQPRLYNPDAELNIANGWWVRTETLRVSRDLRTWT